MLLSFVANAALLKPHVQMQRSSSTYSSNLYNSTIRTPTVDQLDGRAGAPPPATEADSHNTPMPCPWHVQTLSAINESTKWTVSAAVLAVLLWQRNEYAAWCVVGAVLSSFLCKVLKRVLDHERPDNAPKRDPGMPSSHANSLNFLSVYAAISLAHYTSNSPVALALAAATLCLGVFKTWLRVFLGFHTWPQVLVGAALGATTAASWFALGTAWALPALQQSAAGLTVLYAVTGLGSAAFGAKIISGWWKDQQQEHRRRLQGVDRQPQQDVLAATAAAGDNDGSVSDDDEGQRLLQQQPPSAAPPCSSVQLSAPIKSGVTM